MCASHPGSRALAPPDSFLTDRPLRSRRGLGTEADAVADGLPGCCGSGERISRREQVAFSLDRELEGIAVLDRVGLLVVGEADLEPAAAESQREAQRVPGAGRCGVIDSAPSYSRTPPKPNTSARQTPAAEATWTPSAMLPETSARSISSAERKYSSAVFCLPISAATMLWMHAESDESPVVRAS